MQHTGLVCAQLSERKSVMERSHSLTFLLLIGHGALTLPHLSLVYSGGSFMNVPCNKTSVNTPGSQASGEGLGCQKLRE